MISLVCALQAAVCDSYQYTNKIPMELTEKQLQKANIFDFYGIKISDIATGEKQLLA